MSHIKINYLTSIEGQTKRDTICLIFPENLFKFKHNRIFRTDESQDYPDEITESRFLVKMQCRGRESQSIMEIYFMPPNQAHNTDLTWHCDESIVVLSQEYRAVQANKWQYLGTLNKRYLTYDAENGHCLHLKYLKVTFKMSNYNMVAVHQTNMQHLSEDFKDLLNNGLFSDVIIKSVEGIEYKVHKVVLASRSAVLKAHFEHNTTECFTNLLESPLESDVLQEVLTFIYSDKAPQVDDIPEKLLAAADYYQLSKLKSLCEQALQKKLTVDNALEMLQLADIHSADNLKQWTLVFIKDSQAKLFKTVGWAKVKSVDLIKSICEYIVTGENDDDDNDE